ncbi:MAG: hypothetical protein JO111_12820 [Caulobacteraceae bacterium]|nr:hypothetical protein [Caulobacteraceae bacterium]
MAAFCAVLTLGWLAALAAGVPGHFSVDSVSQLAQGRTGRFDDWHPPLMAWLLGLTDRVTPGAALFVVADVTVFFLSLLGWILADGRPRARALLVLALVAASPQALVFQGVVWKDIVFADAALAAFVAFAHAGRADGVGRGSWLAAGFVCCVVAALVRQTGFVVPVAAAGVYVAIEVRGRRRTLTRALAGAGVGLLAVGIIAVLSHAAFAARSDGRPGAAAQLAMLRVYDLAGALRLEPDLPLRALHARAPALERFERVVAAPAWKANTIDGLDDLPGAARLLPPRTAALEADWWSLVIRHPWRYARVRAQVFWMTLATPDSADCPLVSVGIQSRDRAELARAGLRPRLNRRDQWDEEYVWDFWGTPVLSHLAWAILALSLIGLDFRDVAKGDCRPGVFAAIGLLAAAFAYVGTFFLASLACDYRYLYLLDLAAMAALVRRMAAKPFQPQAAFPTTAVARLSSLPHPTR